MMETKKHKLFEGQYSEKDAQADKIFDAVKGFIENNGWHVSTIDK